MFRVVPDRPVWQRSSVHCGANLPSPPPCNMSHRLHQKHSQTAIASCRVPGTRSPEGDMEPGMDLTSSYVSLSTVYWTGCMYYIVKLNCRNCLEFCQLLVASLKNFKTPQMTAQHLFYFWPMPSLKKFLHFDIWSNFLFSQIEVDILMF